MGPGAVGQATSAGSNLHRIGKDRKIEKVNRNLLLALNFSPSVS